MRIPSVNRICIEWLLQIPRRMHPLWFSPRKLEAPAITMPKNWSSYFKMPIFKYWQALLKHSVWRLLCSFYLKQYHLIELNAQHFSVTDLMLAIPCHHLNQTKLEQITRFTFTAYLKYSGKKISVCSFSPQDARITTTVIWCKKPKRHNKAKTTGHMMLVTLPLTSHNSHIRFNRLSALILNSPQA